MAVEPALLAWRPLGRRAVLAADVRNVDGSETIAIQEGPMQGLGLRITVRLAATFALAIGCLGINTAAIAASASTLSKAVQTTLCATPTGKYCSQTLTAMIAAGTQVTVVCSHGPAYYIRVTARQNQEGYVKQSAVSDPPSGLTDCDSASHQAIWAAALAIGYLGSTSPYGIGTCLKFVIDMWRETGVNIGSAGPQQTAVNWWGSPYNIWTKETRGSSEYMTPPRGALVFWGPDRYSNAGHVAISMGNGWLVSTQEGDTIPVHLLTIKERNAEPGVGAYLGWIKP
jgi:cell wall-associated NlpC family hydrolase